MANEHLFLPNNLMFQMNHLLKRVFRKLETLNQERQIKILRRHKRYSSGKFIFKKKQMLYPDAESFAFMYDELFKKCIYKFNTNNKKPFIIDCGANIGMSIIFFKELYPNATITGFEPDKGIFEYLSKNVKEFGYENVTLVNKGVWKAAGWVEFESQGDDSGKIAVDLKQKQPSNLTRIETVKLSDHINCEVDFLKMDIEGAEVAVMHEIEPKLHFVKNIFIEFHSYTDKKQELDQILKILSDNNFHYYIYSVANLRRYPFMDHPVIKSMDCLLNICAEKKNEKV